MHTELGQQMREKEQKIQADVNERKELVMTSGGPVMEAEDVEYIEKKFKA